MTDRRWILPSLLVGAYGVALAWGSIAGFPASTDQHTWMPFLSTRPVGEDAFYYLSIAWNLASGKGFTADGMTVTTGVQPLFPLLLAIPAKIIRVLDGTRWHLIRFVILFETVCFVVFAHLAAGLVGDLHDGADDNLVLVTFVLAIANYPLFRLFTYGLETGVYLIALVYCVRWTHRAVAGKSQESSPAVSPWRLGILFGVTGWIRIDFGVALGVFYALALWRGRLEWSYVLKSGAAAAVIVAPWLGFVWYHTGTPMPSSGIAEAQFLLSGEIEARIAETVVSFTEVVAPFVYLSLTRSTALVGLAIGVSVLVGAVSLYRRGELRPTQTAIMWLASFAVLGAIYLLAYRSIWFYPRYFAPFYVLLLPLTAKVLLHYSGGRAALIWVLAVVQFAAWSFVILHYATNNKAHAVASGTLREEPFASAKVGSFQSGKLGYFNPGVVNLDGKVNFEVLSYLRQHRLCEYLEREKIDYVIDWPTLIERHISAECLQEEWTACGHGEFGTFACRRRR